MEYKDKVVIVTGGAQGIGKCIAEEFRKQGALVEVIDKQEGLDHFVGDLSNKYAIEEFTKLVIEKYGKVDFIVNNALPLMKGIDECSYEEFEYALKVGVTAPFYMVKLLKNHLPVDYRRLQHGEGRPHLCTGNRQRDIQHTQRQGQHPLRHRGVHTSRLPRTATGTTYV